MLQAKNISFTLPDGSVIFENISFILQNEKVGLIGKNGIGKSTIIKMLCEKIKPSNGIIENKDININYLPQKFTEVDHETVADVFYARNKLEALGRIEQGVARDDDYILLENNWDIEEKIFKKLARFNLNYLDLGQSFPSLSGGEKTKVLLSKTIDEGTNFLILDEPTNNMDYQGKIAFYDFVKKWKHGMFVVSHDRELLSLMDRIYELRKVGLHDTKIFNYGGNFEEYLRQRDIEKEASEQTYKNAISELKKRKKQIQEDKEKRDRRAKTGNDKRGHDRNSGSHAKAAFDYKQNIAEKKASSLIKRDTKNLSSCESSLKESANKMDLSNNLYFKVPRVKLPSGKVMVHIKDLCFGYKKEGKSLFNNFNLTVTGAERIAIEGVNGSGKSTLFKIIMGQIKNHSGSMCSDVENIVYLDQEQSILDENKTILENMKNFNPQNSELDCRSILAQFLFRTDSVFKKIRDLSGGEKLRAALACVLFGEKTPQMLILDEPTNNMDLNSIEILEKVLKEYTGAILLVSHDSVFKKNAGIEKVIATDD